MRMRVWSQAWLLYERNDSPRRHGSVHVNVISRFVSPIRAIKIKVNRLLRDCFFHLMNERYTADWKPLKPTGPNRTRLRNATLSSMVFLLYYFIIAPRLAILGILRKLLPWQRNCIIQSSTDIKNSTSRHRGKSHFGQRNALPFDSYWRVSAYYITLVTVFPVKYRNNPI